MPAVVAGSDITKLLINKAFLGRLRPWHDSSYGECSNNQQAPEWGEKQRSPKSMKRTLSVLTAVLFAGALAAPAMAQSAPTQKPDPTVAQAEGAAPAPAEPAAEPTPKHRHHGHRMHHKK